MKFQKWHGLLVSNGDQISMALNPFFLGRLIAIGGNEDKANELVVLKRVVKEIGKTGFRVGVITTASEDPEQRGKEYQQVFGNVEKERPMV